jgi:ABC-type phosphate transport system permease subunit
MTDIFVQIIFGWPAIITAIILSITGVTLKKPVLLVIAGIVCTPFTYYVSNGFRNPALLLPLFQFASAFAITRQRNGIAWLLIAPLVVVSTMLAYVVLTQ